MSEDRATARDRVIEEHLSLVRRIAQRFAWRGEELDDLVQVGAIGLINAVDRFEPSRGVPFTSYAVPCIAGEIQRHLRDRACVVRIPRRVQQRRSEEDPIRVLVVEMSDPRWADARDEAQIATNRVAIGHALRHLSDRERQLIKRRFFDDRNQDEIALELGISQVQVSRLLRSCLDRLCAELDDRVVVCGSKNA